jgi:hypothetical protein
MAAPPTAAEVLDREFLAVRAKLIDTAAVLDRIDRAEGSVAGDPRLDRIRQGLQLLASDTSDRVEQLQLLFSLPYAENWRKEYGL